MPNFFEPVSEIGYDCLHDETRCIVTKARAGWVASILPVLVLVLSGAAKLSGGQKVAEGFEHLGWPFALAIPLGMLELACVAVYLIPATSVLGAILITGYMGGAIATHVRIGEPFFVQLLLGVFVWLGLYLRDARLQALLPLSSGQPPR